MPLATAMRPTWRPMTACFAASVDVTDAGWNTSCKYTRTVRHVRANVSARRRPSCRPVLLNGERNRVPKITISRHHLINSWKTPDQLGETDPRILVRKGARLVLARWHRGENSAGSLVAIKKNSSMSRYMAYPKCELSQYSSSGRRNSADWKLIMKT